MENIKETEVKKARESFIFYKSFHDALECIATAKEYRKVVEAILNYAIYDKKAEITEFTRQGKMALMLIAPQLKINKIKYENGIKGGRPKPNLKLT